MIYTAAIIGLGISSVLGLVVLGISYIAYKKEEKTFYKKVR